MRTITKIIIEIAHASPKLGFSSAITLQIWTARVVAGWSIPTLSCIAVPIANINAALSPIILPIQRIIEVKMPGSALGRITLNAVWVKEAPRAKEALLYVFGIALILSSVVLITVGRSMIDKVKAPARTLAPLEEDILLTKGIKTIKEINPKIIDGIPPIISIKLLNKEVNLLSFAYNDK